MNKVDMIKEMKNNTGLTKDQVEDFFVKYKELIEYNAKKGEKTPFPGIGNFEMKEHSARKERIGRNPSTGAEITIPASPAFRTINLNIPKSVKEAFKEVE